MENVKQDDKLSVNQKVQAPEHAVFRPGEIFPMKGYLWKVKGWTTNWEVVFECVGRTGKASKKLKVK